jgi:hypothetical protein
MSLSPPEGDREGALNEFNAPILDGNVIRQDENEPDLFHKKPWVKING